MFATLPIRTYKMIRFWAEGFGRLPLGSMTAKIVVSCNLATRPTDDREHRRDGRAVAQVVARLTGGQKAAGSSPVSPTGGCLRTSRTPSCGARFALVTALRARALERMGM